VGDAPGGTGDVGEGPFSAADRGQDQPRPARSGEEGPQIGRGSGDERQRDQRGEQSAGDRYQRDGAATAVRGVSLQVQAGEIVGLVGESGSGKTLTCRAALGVLPDGCAVERGTVSFAGHNVTSLSRRGWERLHGSQMGAVFQDPASYLNPVLTVGGQLAEVLRVKLRMSRREARGRSLELFKAVGLRQPERVFHQIPAELSGACVFAARCPFAAAICAAQPSLTSVGERWSVACHRHEEWGTLAQSATSQEGPAHAR
jgi:ABC-type lipoprotein export system ATPase subunit